MDYRNNGPYQALKNNPTTKFQPKTLKKLKILKYNNFIEIKSPKIY